MTARLTPVPSNAGGQAHVLDKIRVMLRRLSIDPIPRSLERGLPA
jgi:hypothetical protein